jgi:capsular polysaccharide transport system permease protein
MKKQLSIEYNVIRALFFREIQTRFNTKLSYFWALFDTMSLILVFAFLKSMFSNSLITNVDYVSFLTIGFVGFFLWRNIVNKSLNAFEANRALFIYQRVRPYHTLITRTLVETIVFLTLLVLFFVMGWYFGYDVNVDNYLLFIVAYIWLILFGYSIGFMSAMISFMFPMYEKIFNAIMIPMIFVSAIMYTVGSMPTDLREILLLNPLTHFMELLHGSFFANLTIEYVSFSYMFYWTIVPLLIGLFIYRFKEEGIIAS